MQSQNVEPEPDATLWAAMPRRKGRRQDAIPSADDSLVEDALEREAARFTKGTEPSDLEMVGGESSRTPNGR